MRTARSDAGSLAGTLLLAHPVLREPHFRHAAILVVNHDTEGALGLVFNHPTGRRLGEHDPDFALGPLASVAVFQGGPVEEERVFLCGWRALAPEEGEGFQLMFGLDPHKAADLAGQDGMHLRAFLGYSGWSAGQLEGELKRDTWVVVPLPSDLMQRPPDDELWRAVLGGVSPLWNLLANEPDDPGEN